MSRASARRMVGVSVAAAVLFATAGSVTAQTPSVRPAPEAEDRTAGPTNATASEPANPTVDVSGTLIPDPWSGPNHAFYRLSMKIDRAVIAPAIRGYNHVVPGPVRTGLDNAINNLDEPRTVVNDVLQGRFKPAGTSTARFLLNSTVGLAGLIDVATKSGLERHESDFGQTLGRYGVRSGPYIFVPLAGPSSLRDGVGRVVDIFADPLGLLAGGLGTTFGDVRAGVATVDERANVGDQIDQVNGEFTDPYGAIRSAYSQQRASKVAIARGQTEADVKSLPDFGPSPPQGPPAAPVQPTPTNQ